MARTTRRTQGHCWGGDKPAGSGGCGWEHHHVLCCCSIHLGEETGPCKLLVKLVIPAVAPREDKPRQVPPPLLPHKVQQQPFSSASLSHTPLYLLPICVFSPTSPSPDCCSCVSPFVSSFLLAHLVFPPPSKGAGFSHLFPPAHLQPWEEAVPKQGSISS